MRKIESDMLAAIARLRAARETGSWSSGNTTVKNYYMPNGGENVTKVFLHGNHIATIYAASTVHVTLAGWDTNLTRGRLHLLVSHYHPGAQVRRIRRQTYLVNRDGSRQAMGAHDWYAPND